MANLKETSTWENGIYQIEENDPVHGGENGITNRPAKQLANRTKWLNDNKVAKTATIMAGNGLTGGGDLSTNRSLALGTPSQITATSSNSVTAESHSHAIDKASTTVAGIVQLNDSLTSTSNTQALTANQGKILQDTKANKAGETFTGRVKATDFIAPRWRSAEPISLFRETSNDAQQLYTGGLLISNNYADNTHIPAHGIYAKGQIKTDAGFIGNLTGNSASATQLQNPRTINGVAFDGSQNITIADNTKVAKSGDSMTGSLNLLADNTMINVGNNDDIAIIKKSGLGGAIAFGANNRFRVYKSNNARVSPSDTLTQVFEVDTNGFATANKFIGTLQGNADTSTQLQTPRIINGVAFDGSQNINIEAPLMYRGNANTAEQLDNAKQTGFYLVNNNPTITNLGLYNYGVLYVYQRGDVVHQLYYAHVPNTKGSCATRITWHNDWIRSANWRIIDTPLNNTLTSTATDQALTAAQGKILNESKIDKVDVRIAKANVDVDTYKNDGNYAFFYGALNLPFSGAGKLQVISGNNGNYVTQIAYPYPSESNEVYIRSQTAYNEGFSTWKRLDGADWSDIRNKPTSLNSYSNEFIGTLRWGGTAQTAQNALPFAITQGRIQSFSSLILNADTDNSASGVEHILLSASNGLSSDTNTGLTIRSNGVKWKNGRTEIADNGDVIVRNPNGYSGLALMGTDGSYIRIESNPTLATSATSFGNLIYRNSAGTNQAVISLPRKNGMMLLATDIINAVNNTNATAPASANAVKTAYDKAVEAEKKALPIGSVVAFPKEISNPVGFLLCNGTNFTQATYPDLYRALGNKTKLPQLTRSDVGQLSYFPSNTIPDGWLECNGQTISQTVYPELYAYLGNKYGANGKLPNAEDRFIRNASNGLTVGTIQDDAIKTHNIQVPDSSNLGTNMGVFFYGDRGGVNNQEYNILTYDGADETRPKSIVFKLCIKSKNSFDDVQFWIKAYGEVVNVGQLDASKLANDLRNHTHTVSQISDFITQVQARIQAGLQIQRKDYSARLTPTHNSFRTQTVNITGSVEVLPDGRIIQRFTFVCPVAYFHRYGLSAFYREKLGVSSFTADDTPLLELPLWTAMPNKVQEARIHLSANLNHHAFGEALEWNYDWDSIFNQHVNIKDKAYFAFNRIKGGNDEPVTFNIVVEGY